MLRWNRVQNNHLSSHLGDRSTAEVVYSRKVSNPVSTHLDDRSAAQVVYSRELSNLCPPTQVIKVQLRWYTVVR
jgi:hypothetical protein